MTEQTATRGPRGAYSAFICLNCRARKIKCHLPDSDVQPTGVPQSRDKACQRCRSLNLQCIVQPTILGRPAAKRKRPEQAVTEDNTSQMISKRTIEEHVPDDADIKSYLLTRVDDGDWPSDSKAFNAPGTAQMFQAMVSAPHLISSLLARDRYFSAAVVSASGQSPVSLVRLISPGKAALLDENLTWHRLYQPLLPKLVKLRDDLVLQAKELMGSSTPLLFALGSLIALDVSSSPLKDDQHLREELKIAVIFYGEEMLFNLPTHRNTITALMMLANYKPTILIRNQKHASTAIRAELYSALAYRVAQRLDLRASVEKLSSYLQDENAVPSNEVKSYVLDCLQWCHILTADAFLASFLSEPLAHMPHILTQIKPISETVQAALSVHCPTPSMILYAHSIQAICDTLEGLVAAKESWRDLQQLGNIIQHHEKRCTERYSEVNREMTRIAPEDWGDIEESTLRLLIDIELSGHKVALSGAAIFYAIMSRLKLQTVPKDDFGEIVASEALQVSDQLIDNLKNLQIGAVEFNTFLDTFGGSREMMLEETLRKFVQASDNLKSGNVPFLPPPKHLPLRMLFHAKILVENSAARMKGWGGLHPRVDEHLALFAACADRIEAMAAGGRSLTVAFFDGCIYAATAKFIRSLRNILLDWKANVAARSANTVDDEFRNTDGSLAAQNFVGGSEPIPEADLDFDELFEQWSNWPSIEMVDMGQLLPNESLWA